MSHEEDEMESPLMVSGMQMVMAAGDARELIRHGLDLARQGRFDEADARLHEAEAQLARGHRVQTEVIQLEAAGASQGYNVLFAHGMDTLMTIKSEHQLGQVLVDTLRSIDERFRRLEAGAAGGVR